MDKFSSSNIVINNQAYQNEGTSNPEENLNITGNSSFQRKSVLKNSTPGSLERKLALQFEIWKLLSEYWKEQNLPVEEGYNQELFDFIENCDQQLINSKTGKFQLKDLSLIENKMLEIVKTSFECRDRATELEKVGTSFVNQQEKSLILFSMLSNLRITKEELQRRWSIENKQEEFIKRERERFLAIEKENQGLREEIREKNFLSRKSTTTYYTLIVTIFGILLVGLTWYLTKMTTEKSFKKKKVRRKIKKLRRSKE